MKLLIFTQAVDENNPVLGFFLDWIREFAKHCESVVVICLYKGKHDLPANVKVLSLGKENNRGTQTRERKTWARIKYLINFYKFIWQERKNYDAVFVHMNQVYVILGGWLWRWWNKKIGLWYAHGHVPFSLRVAEKMTNIVFTSTVGGFRLKSPKIEVVGQGMDIEKFKPVTEKKENGKFRIITVGRISPTKDYETLIKAIEIIAAAEVSPDVKVNIVGEPGTPEQEKYFLDLQTLVKTANLEKFINFIGPIPNNSIVGYLQSADLFVNMSHTGSLDKAVLEAMTVGLPILTCNEAFVEFIPDDLRDSLLFKKGEAGEMAIKIKNIRSLTNRQKAAIGQKLNAVIIQQHSLKNLIKKILDNYINVELKS